MENGKQTIVIIDDEKRMCDSLSALLDGDGYSVQTYQKPSDAADAICQSRVDLVITDIKMPGMDGLEILRIVKDADEDLPVILMTGFASLETALEAISHGAYDYLLKPVEFTYLGLAVKRALEKRRADLDRRQLLQELRLSNMILNRRIGELNALYEAGKSIGSTINIKELLQQIIALATAVTDAQLGSIMLLDESAEYLTIEAAIGLSEKVISDTRLPVGSSIAGHVAEHGEPLMIVDVEHDDRFRRINQEKYGAASLLCAPLKIKNKVIGVINMANKAGDQEFSNNDLRLLTTFASQAAVAVDDANQFEKNRRRLIEFEILHEVSAEMPEIRSLNRFRGVLIEKLNRVFPIDVAIWFDYDAEQKMLIPQGAAGEAGVPLTDSGGIDLRKINRDAISLSSFDPSGFNFSDIAALTDVVRSKLIDNPHLPGPTRAAMAVPVLRHHQPGYVFYLGTDQNRSYSDEDISLAKLVISQAALLFEREKSLLNATRLLTMGNMISEISHDLRKPLTSIKGGLQIIKKRWPEIMAQSEFFQTAEEEVQRMNELVRELVDFSNPNKYETAKIDLRRIVTRASELVSPDMRKKSISFDSSFQDANWEVYINKNQILEALLNLFMNAIDAMPDGGELRADGLIEKPEHKQQEYLAIKICDSGCGIDHKNLPRIFNRYYTTKETGTGLGLAVVERIISAHSGTLAVFSEIGQGTTFTLYFPMTTG